MQLSGKKILVVEDDAVLARPLCEKLSELGATIFGPAPTVSYATQLLGARRVDLAILDTVLHGQPVFELADWLVEKGITFVFAIEEGREPLPVRYAGWPTVSKPFDLGRTAESIMALVAQRQAEHNLPRQYWPAAQPPSDPRQSHAITCRRMARAVSAALRRTPHSPGSSRR